MTLKPMTRAVATIAGAIALASAAMAALSALIQPGKTQTFRIQWVGDPAITQSKHYYVTVAQLPVKLPTDQTAIQVLYDFQVIVNVGPAGAKPHLVVARTEIVKNAITGKFNPIIYVSNDSTTYGYLSHGHMKIIVTDASGKQILNKSYVAEDINEYIGAGLVASCQTRPFTIPMDLPTGEGKVDVSYTPEDF
jgi:fimbrial chaperone protein